jgi:hypothetical protein
VKTIALLFVLICFTALSADLAADQDNFSSIPAWDNGANEEPAFDSRPENLRAINTWDGSYNSFWYAPSNWSLNHIPLATEDVVIPVVSSGRYPAITGNYVCNTIAVNNGADLNFSSGRLDVTADAALNGKLYMSSSTTLAVNGSLIFSVNAMANFNGSAIISVKKHVTFQNGSSINIPNTKLELRGTEISYIGTYTPTIIGTLFTSKPVSGSTNISTQSTATLSIKSLEVASASKISHPYTGTTIIRGDIVLFPTSTVNLSAGSLRMSGSANAVISDLNSASNYLNNLEIEKDDGASVSMNTNLTVKGKVEIWSGALIAQTYTLKVGGEWMNAVAGSEFVPGTGTVIFNQSNSVQAVYGPNSFYNVLDNHTGNSLTFYDYTEISSLLTVNSEIAFLGGGSFNSVSNTADEASLEFYTASYLIDEYTGGGSLKSTGSAQVIITDLTQFGINGNFTADNGHLEIHQDIYSPIDIYGNITIHNDGIVDIYGGEYDLYIGFLGYSIFTMSSGSFNVKDRGISISSFTGGCDFIITGGTITVNGDWRDTLGVFDPTGGSVVMTGSGDNTIIQHADSWFWNLVVNKVATREVSEPQFSYDRDGNQTLITRSSNLAINAVTIKGGLNIQAANTVFLQDDMNSINNGTINIENADFILQEYNLISTGNLNINANGNLIIVWGSALLMSDGRNITVNDGGSLRLNAGLITHNGTGYYGLNVESGGTIGAFGSMFEYMNVNGIMLKEGSLVDTNSSFDYCTFWKGAQYGRLLTINNGQSFVVEGAIFPPNTWDSIYNVSKAVDGGMVYFKDWTGNFSGPNFEQDPHNRIYWEGYDGVPPVTNLSIDYFDILASIVLLWDHPASSGVTFKIYRSANPDGPFVYYDSIENDHYWSEPVSGHINFYKVTADLP